MRSPLHDHIADGDHAATGYSPMRMYSVATSASTTSTATSSHQGSYPDHQSSSSRGSTLVELEPARVVRRGGQTPQQGGDSLEVRPPSSASRCPRDPLRDLPRGEVPPLPRGGEVRVELFGDARSGSHQKQGMARANSDFPTPVKPPLQPQSYPNYQDRPEQGCGFHRPEPLSGCSVDCGPSNSSPGLRVWSRESIAADPKGYLMRMLDPFLPANNMRVRDQVGTIVSQTLSTVTAAANASFEKERVRSMETHQEVQEELRAVQLDLENTEQNRAELAKLLEATILTTQQVATATLEGPDSEGLALAAARIQRWWRRWRSRRYVLGTANGRPVDPYDVVVCFDSLSATLDPGCLSIEILRWACSEFNIGVAEREGVRIVAHMGLFDKGKTFLINQLYGKNLPSGKLHETTGLSMIYLPKQRFLVIDTKGLQAPVSYKTKGVRQLVDASQTEIFLFELVSRLAHYIVFVVNDFTWPEQRHIVQLHQKYVQSKRENQLIVAHNLRTTRSVREATELFWKQVASKYEGVERSELGGLIFTVDEKPRIHHIGFAEHLSPAGKMFNEKNAAHVLHLLDQLEGIGERQRSVAEMLQIHFAALLPEFVFLEEATTGQRMDGTALRVTGELETAGLEPGFEPDEEKDPMAYRSAGTLRVQIPHNHRVLMKTEGVFSEFCELVAQDITFKPPPPNVYEQRLKDKIVRLMEFEIPGVSRRDITFKRGNRGMSLTMARLKDKQLANYGVAPRFQAPRIPTGEFSFDLFFDDGIWELDGGREAVSHQDGLLRIRLKQDLEGQVFTLDTL